MIYRSDNLLRQVHCYSTWIDMNQSIKEGHDNEMSSIVPDIAASRNATEPEDRALLVLREDLECQLAGYG